MFRDREFVSLLLIVIPFEDIFGGTKCFLKGHIMFQGLIHSGT